MTTQSSVDFRFVVDKLNEILNRNLTLVTFEELCEEKSRVLGLLNELLEKITETADFAIPSEMSKLEGKFKILGNLFFNTLKIVSVREMKPYDLFRSVIEGDIKVTHPLIRKIVKMFDGLKLRFYLSKYIQKVVIPEEIRHDEIFDDTNKEYDARVDEFKKVHQTYLSVRREKGDFNPEQTKLNIQKLQKQLLLVKKKISDQTDKIKELHPNWEKLIDVAENLHSEIKKEESYVDSSHKQEEELIRVRTIYERITKEVEQIRKKIGPQITVEMYLSNLEEEVERLQTLTSVELQQRIITLKRQQTALEALHTRPLKEVSLELENEIRGLQDELGEVNQTIRSLETKRKNPRQEDRELKKLNTSHSIFKKKVREKEKEMRNAMKNFEKEENREIEIDQKLRPFEGKEVLKPQEFDERERDFKIRFDRTKRGMAELEAMKSEDAILQNTLESLKVSYPGVNEFLGDLGSVENVSEQIVELTEQIQTINEEKESSLAELSSMVKEINGKIKEKEKKLAPKVQKLNRLNKDRQNLEVIYSQKKADYENLKGSLDMERMKSTRELFELDEEVNNLQGLYHQLQVEMRLTRIRMDQAEKERKYRKGLDLYSAEHKSYDQLYTSIAKSLQNESKRLVERQKDVNRKYGQSVQQIEWFRDLVSLLEMKKQLVEERNEMAMMNHKNPTFLDGTDTSRLIEKSTKDQDGVEELNIL